MSDPTEKTRRAREVADELVKRLKHDEGFRKAAAEDPDSAFGNLGLPEDITSDLKGGFSPSLRGPGDVCTYTCIRETSECTKSYLV